MTHQAEMLQLANDTLAGWRNHWVARQRALALDPKSKRGICLAPIERTYFAPPGRPEDTSIQTALKRLMIGSHA